MAEYKLIYQSELALKPKSPDRPKKTQGAFKSLPKKILSWLGTIFLAVGLFLFLYYALPIALTEIRYRLFQRQMTQLEEQAKKEGKALDLTGTIFDPVDPNFSLVIPKIGVNAKVFSEVDPADPKAYGPALEKGIAHAKGSCYPDEGCTVYLFSHSTNYLFNIAQYHAYFYLLKEIKYGDEIRVYYQGQRYNYRAIDRKLLKSNQLSEINDTLTQNRLILQTCWPPGTTWQRLLIFAEPMENDQTSAVSSQ